MRSRTTKSKLNSCARTCALIRADDSFDDDDDDDESVTRANLSPSVETMHLHNGSFALRANSAHLCHSQLLQHPRDKFPIAHKRSASELTSTVYLLLRWLVCVCVATLNRRTALIRATLRASPSEPASICRRLPAGTRRASCSPLPALIKRRRKRSAERASERPPACLIDAQQVGNKLTSALSARTADDNTITRSRPRAIQMRTLNVL